MNILLEACLHVYHKTGEKEAIDIIVKFLWLKSNKTRGDKIQHSVEKKDTIFDVLSSNLRDALLLQKASQNI